MKSKPRNRLKVLRAEHGITQMDLAQELGIGRDRYWRIENGYETPTDQELARLAKVLRVSREDLGLPAAVSA